MATRAYFAIRTAAAAAQSGQARWIWDLEAVHGVQSVEPVACEYELRATVEAPITAVLVAHRILANAWVDQVRILRMEERRKRVLRLNLAREIIHACNARMRRFLRIV